MIIPESFGAVGDGLTDDTDALNVWADSLGGGTDGLIENTYLISSVISIVDKNEFKIIGSGSIKIADGTPINEPYSGFFIQQSSDWTMKGITIDGNRNNRDPGPSSGHAIKIRSCFDFELTRLICKNSPTDGILLDASNAQDETTHCRDFHIVECVCINNTRQGLSIIQAHDFEILGGEYSATNGALPGCGIDLEPNTSQDAMNSLTNGMIAGVLLKENQGCGLQVSGKTTTLQIHAVNLVCDGNVSGAIRWGARTGAIVGVLIKNTQVLPTRGQIDVIAKNASALDRGGYVYIIGPTFENIGASDLAHPLVYEHKSAEPLTTLVDMRFDDQSKAFVNLRGEGSSIIRPGKLNFLT